MVPGFRSQHTAPALQGVLVGLQVAGMCSATLLPYLHPVPWHNHGGCTPSTSQPRILSSVSQSSSTLRSPRFLLPARTLPAFPPAPPAPLLAAEGLIWEQPCLREPPQGRLPAAATGCASSLLKFTNLSGRLPCQGDKTRCRLHLAAGSELCRPLLERRSHALD